MGRGRAVRERLTGNERRLGLWILPLFLLAALLGATLLGGLAALYYAQQVDELEATTGAARAAAKDAVAGVRSQTQRARGEIERQVREAREALAQRPPVASPNAAGVYAVSAVQEDGSVRVGTAFTVFSSRAETYLLTAASVVSDEDGSHVGGADLFLPNQTASVRVHAVDRERDLAILVVNGGPLPVLDWRPLEPAVATGDILFVVGVAGTDTPAVLAGRAGGRSERAVVLDAPLNAFLAGAPVLDASGAVVAVASLEYAPFGPVEGDLRYAVPIREVCVQLLDCTAADLGVRE